MLKELKILRQHGKQYIKDVSKPVLPETFRGRPVIQKDIKADVDLLAGLCPTGAILKDPFAIDLGKCVFCAECVFAAAGKIRFTNDYKIATNHRENLLIYEGEDHPIEMREAEIRKEIRRYFGRSLRLRQVSAGGNNADELELNATVNPNFDMSRWGIDWVASPRHADGIVITGPISENMSGPLQTCYDAIAAPKIIILAGTDAISGGIFSGSKALNRTFLDTHKVDLFVPGAPVHPLTFVNGVLKMLQKKTF